VILAGDIGGTKTALALVEIGPARFAVAREAELPSRQFSTFEAAIDAFLGDGPPASIDAACFGVAGPVVDGRCVATNLPWVLDEAQLATRLAARRVKLLNDLEATAHGVLTLGPEALATIQAGQLRPGNIAIIAAGTGLGEALVVRGPDRVVVVPSEGGHADYAPRSDVEIELLRRLRKVHGHVSWERVLSGPGLVETYEFLRESAGTPAPAWLATRLDREDAGGVISEVGQAGTDPVCADALGLLVAAYGAEAGNLALKGLAVGGVFLAGGIAPKILPALTGGGFVAAFRDKGRLADMMAAIPVHVVLEPRAALLGAARVAAALADGGA
jgi:glucokinase